MINNYYTVDRKREYSFYVIDGKRIGMMYPKQDEIKTMYTDYNMNTIYTII